MSDTTAWKNPLASPSSSRPETSPQHPNHCPCTASPTRFAWRGPARPSGSTSTDPRSEKGQYREVTVSEEPLRTDSAIFAALTMLEGRPIDLSRLRQVLPDLVPSYGKSVWDRWTDLAGEESKAELLRSIRHHQTLDYVLLLLRYHRPGFDALPLEDRAALLADSCAHLNDSLETVGKFMSFVEHGVPGRGAVPAAKSIARDLKAAILKDVDSLTYRQIGDRLGIPPPANFDYKGDHASVRKMVGRGRRFFKTSLGDEGYASHVEAMKQEANRRRGMSKIEREAEDLSEAFRIPYEDALERVEEERDEDQSREEQSGPA